MSFLNSIVNWCNTAADFFYDVYVEAHGWIPPFNKIAPFFYALHNVFVGLGWQFYFFNIWVDSVADAIADILPWPAIQSYIRNWLSGIEGVVAWFSNWFYYVQDVVSDFWSSVIRTVQDWIEIAKQYLQIQINNLSAWLARLQGDIQEILAELPSLDEVLAWFGNWWANVLANIETWWNERLLGVMALIESTLRDWFPFYDELAELWNDIKLFFTDPLQWLYNQLDEFFERFW